MFDTNKVANNIKTARTKLNMTQMNLADEMGVSYQAEKLVAINKKIKP